MKILTPWKERKNISKVKIPPMRKHVDCREFTFNFSILCSKNIFSPIEVSHLQQRFFLTSYPFLHCMAEAPMSDFGNKFHEKYSWNYGQFTKKKFYFSVKSISRNFSYLYSFSIQYLIEEIEYCADMSLTFGYISYTIKKVRFS